VQQTDHARRDMVHRTLLSGTPRTKRAACCMLGEIQPYYNGLRVFFRRMYGDAESWSLLDDLMGRVNNLTSEPLQIEAMRALMLIAIWLLPEVKGVYANGVAGGAAEDMAERVMPFVGPRFLKNGAQSPGRMVALCAVLHSMWEGEGLLFDREPGAHHDCP